MKKINCEETEQLIEKKLRKLEAGLSYELPEEYCQTKKDRPVWRVIRVAVSVAAVFAVILGVWYAAEYAKHYSPNGVKPASAYAVTNFPYNEPAVSEEELAEMTALLQSIADDIIKSGQYTAAQYEERHADKIDAAVAYGAKIFRPLIKVLDGKVPNHKNNEPTVTDVVFADICIRIISAAGEEDDLYGHFYELYKEYGDSENAHAILLGVDGLVEVIYEWKNDLASAYKESIEKTELQNAQKGDLSEYRWSFLVLNENGTDTVTFYPRQIFGEKYPVCLMLYDAYYGIDKTTENLSLPSDWDDVEIPETDPVKITLLELVSIAGRYKDGEELQYALIACKVQSEELIAEYGADIFKPLIELQKSRQEERGYKYLYEIDGHNYGVLLLLDNGDAALAEICRRVIGNNGEAEFYNDYVFKLNRIFDEREYTETSVDGLYRMIAMCRRSYSKSAEAFEAAYPVCAAFYEAYRQVWFTSDGCAKVLDAVNSTELGQWWEYDLLGRTLYMTEHEKAEFADKILSANGDNEAISELQIKALKGLRYSKTLMIIKACGEYYVDHIDNYKTVVKAANKLSFEELCKVTESSESIRAFLDNDLRFNTYGNWLRGTFEDLCREKPGLGMRRETVVRLMNSISDEMRNGFMNELFALSDFDASVDALIEKYKVYAKSDSEFYKAEIESIRIMKRVNGVFAGYADVAVGSEFAEKLLSAVYALRIGEPNGQTGWPEGIAYEVGFEGLKLSVTISENGTLLNSDLTRFTTQQESAGRLTEILDSFNFKTNDESAAAQADSVTFSEFDLDGVDSIRFQPESPTARYKGKRFTKDGNNPRLFEALISGTKELQLARLSETPARAYEDVTTYRITFYRGKETVLSYRADTEALLFFYNNGKDGEKVYTSLSSKWPAVIHAIEDAKNALNDE